MISRAELNPHGYVETPEIKANLDILLETINKVRTEWGKPMVVTSGLRNAADQARINPKAPLSKHIVGAAVDIKDPVGELFAWCKAHEDFLKAAGVKGIELGTNGWTHFQILPVRSGSFWFNP